MGILGRGVAFGQSSGSGYRAMVGVFLFGGNDGWNMVVPNDPALYNAYVASRGTVALPHGTGRSVRVAVITKGENVQAAEAAGADVVGSDELIDRIAGGFMDFDAVVATPDMMAQIGQKLARLLGPRGLLPNPKSGTVGPDVAGMVRGLKAGRIEFRNDKTGVVHAPIGKASFESGNLSANYQALISALEGAKPGTAKGVFLRSAYLTTTMGPSIPLALGSAALA